MIRYGVSVDYSSTPDDWAEWFGTVVAAGRDFVIRDIQSVTVDELSAGAAAVVDTVFLFNVNWNPRRYEGGISAGHADADTVVSLLSTLSADGCPVYFNIPVDALGPPVDLYFQGVRQVLAKTQVGVRAGWKVIDYLKKVDRVKYFAQTIDWQYGHGWHSAAQLRQVATNYPLDEIVCSKYDAMVAAFGQFRSGSGIEPASPATVPIPFVQGNAPHGLVIRWGRTDENLVLKLKDENGGMIECRGSISQRNGGMVPRVTVLDPSSLWDHIGVEWVFNNKSVGQIIRQCVENPTGNCATGIVCHVEEVTTAAPKVTSTVYPTLRKGSKGEYVRKAQDLLNKAGWDPPLEVDGVFGNTTYWAVRWFQTYHETVDGKALVVDGVIGPEDWASLTANVTGNPLTVKIWSGHGKSLRSVLDEFADMTGCRWTLYSENMQWHFYFGSHVNWPEWDVLSDNVTQDNPGVARRLVLPEGEAEITQTNADFANRVYYTKTIEPPALPPGLTDWDQVWTEDPAKWKAYSTTVAVGNGDKYTGFGTTSIKFTYTFTKTASNSLPTYLDLGYVPVPGPLCDMSSWYWGWFYARVKHRITTNQGIRASRIPRHLVNLHMGLHSGAYPGPSVLNPANAYYAHPNQAVGDSWTLVKWRLYGYMEEKRDAKTGEILFDPTNIHWLQLRAELSNPSTVTALTTGHTWKFELWLDQLHPVGATAQEDAPTTSTSFVETQAVTDGKEQPVAMTLQDNSLPYADTEELALLALAEHNRMRETFSTLPVTGIVRPPILSRFPLELVKAGVAPSSYPAVEIVRKPFEDVTEFTIGDIPYDEEHANAVILRTLDRMRAQQK